jgi:hypothetical protein
LGDVNFGRLRLPKIGRHLKIPIGDDDPRAYHNSRKENLVFHFVLHQFFSSPMSPRMDDISSAMDSIFPSEEDIMILIYTAANATSRQVRFAQEVVSSLRSSPIRSEEAKDLWYSQNDLAAFKAEVREIALSLREGHPVKCESTRGLKNWNDVERCKHRITMTIRYTLQAHGEGMSADQIATVARKCTAWSKEVALVQALHDYCDAYEPSMSSLVPEVNIAPPEFSATKKRNAATLATASPERRVRCRIH